MKFKMIPSRFYLLEAVEKLPPPPPPQNKKNHIINSSAHNYYKYQNASAFILCIGGGISPFALPPPGKTFKQPGINMMLATVLQH